jgi:hypothetical protein
VKGALPAIALAACSAAPGPSALEAPTGRASGAPQPPPIEASVSPPSPIPAPALSDVSAEAAFALPIPARDQADESPAEGWCGETAIQEGLLYLGVWAPQQLIHRAGRPRHPDLYADEIPIALAVLGVRYTFYPAKARSFPAFAAWARGALEDGDPVLAGVKILPTAHPRWDLDHFVLVVGHGAKGLLVNTTWGSRAWVADDETGLSLRGAVYGIRLHGLRLAANARPARLAVLAEGEATVTVRASCSGLESGKPYRLERRRHARDREAEGSMTLVAASGRVDAELTVDAGVPSQFQCVSP